LKLQSGLRLEEVYRLLFEEFSRKRRWKVRSFKEPLLIVITTGFPLPNRSSDLAGGLAKIAIEAKDTETEVSFSFDFRVWYFSHFAFELVVAYLLWGVYVLRYLESQSFYEVLIIGFLMFGLLFIPWFSHRCVKNTEETVVSQSEAPLRRAEVIGNI